MPERIEIDAYRPRPDRVADAANVARRGGLIAFPTDTTWVVACDAHDRAAATRLRALRVQMSGDAKDDERKPLSLMCPDLADIGTFALVDQPRFRLLRRLLPGPYTVILPASRQVPRQLRSKRRAIGVRLPDHPVALAILEATGAPFFVTTCHHADGTLMAASPEIEDAIGRQIDAIVETEPISPEPSTVVDWADESPVLVRQGKGEPDDDWASPE